MARVANKDPYAPEPETSVKRVRACTECAGSLQLFDSSHPLYAALGEIPGESYRASLKVQLSVE